MRSWIVGRVISSTISTLTIATRQKVGGSEPGVCHMFCNGVQCQWTLKLPARQHNAVVLEASGLLYHRSPLVGIPEFSGEWAVWRLWATSNCGTPSCQALQGCLITAWASVVASAVTPHPHRRKRNEKKQISPEEKVLKIERSLIASKYTWVKGEGGG